jgi:DNA-binding response OmpR family regulator
MELVAAASKGRRSSTPPGSTSQAPEVHSTDPPVSGEKRRAPAIGSTGRVRVALADHDAEVRGWLSKTLTRLADVVEAEHGIELERTLRDAGPFDLVVTRANLPVQTGLSVLARCRAGGDATPFVVITSVQRKSLTVFVSDAEGTVLSSRVVDSDNLLALALSLIERARRAGA